MTYQHSSNIFLVLVVVNVTSIFIFAQEYGKLKILIVIRLYEDKLNNVNILIGNFIHFVEYANYGAGEYPEDYYGETIDPCKGGEWGAMEIEGKSKHQIFYESNLTPIRDYPEWKMARLCCDDHSYVFKDECTVDI